MTAPWRTHIVDDEPLVRGRIRTLLAADPELVVTGESSDGRAAVEALTAQPVHLLLLDIQMPELDGFDVLAALDPRPLTVFITAYDEHALRAFEAHAIDYLLKPFDQDRFETALARAKQFLRGAPPPPLEPLLGELRSQRRPSTIPVKRNGRIFFLRTAEIDWVEAAGNYVCLHAASESHIMRETMAEAEARLDPERFVRIHRSTIVNIERILELRPWFHGDYQVILSTGAELILSRGRRERLEQLMGRIR